MANTLATAGGSVRQIVATVAAPVTALLTTVQADRSLLIPGATPDMTFVVCWPSLDAGLIMGGAWCDVAGTVKLRLYNPTVSTITPAAATLKVIGL